MRLFPARLAAWLRCLLPDGPSHALRALGSPALQQKLSWANLQHCMRHPLLRRRSSTFPSPANSSRHWSPCGILRRWTEGRPDYPHSCPVAAAATVASEALTANMIPHVPFTRKHLVARQAAVTAGKPPERYLLLRSGGGEAPSSRECATWPVARPCRGHRLTTTTSPVL